MIQHEADDANLLILQTIVTE